MTFHYVYAGVHWEFETPFALDPGAMVPAELWLAGDPILQDPDEWHEVVGTAYPFTVDGVHDWWEHEGVEDSFIQAAAIAYAQDSRI